MKINYSTKKEQLFFGDLKTGDVFTLKDTPYSYYFMKTATFYKNNKEQNCVILTTGLPDCLDLNVPIVFYPNATLYLSPEGKE